MYVYAQTNIRLYRQLDERGYAPDDVGAVGRAYELALRLFTCVYRGSGKPFLAHAVGTASILASLRARMPVIAAGLLHAAYTHGEFGNGWRGVSPPKRREVRRAVGEEVESLVARYTELAWHAGTIGGIRGQPRRHDVRGAGTARTTTARTHSRARRRAVRRSLRFRQDVIVP